MKEVIFNISDYKSTGETYKDFYRDVFVKLDGKGIIDFEDLPDLHFHADILNEFMWYNHNENLKLVFVGLDLDKIKKDKRMMTQDGNSSYLLWKILLKNSQTTLSNSEINKH